MSEKKTIGSVMVVGGGIAGIQASLDLADSGYKVYMVEQSSSIGGSMAKLDKTFPTNDCSMCVISPKLVEAGRNLNIELFTMTEVESLEGKHGNFRVKLKKKPRFIQIDKCTACGECEKICPIEIDNNFDQGLSNRKAAYKLYPQAMPSAYAIEKRGQAPCKASCPANPSIQGCIALMQRGKYKEAFELFRQEHPMPGICGRVCHHPCENSCTRSHVDKPVSIMGLHRFLADWARNNSVEFTPQLNGSRKEKAAIIGSGPAGLTCAYFLAIEGFKVTIFEKKGILGGMLTLGIPAYRLPRDVIDEEINVLKKMGVQFRTKTNVGSDLTIEELRNRGYKAFFIAIGAHQSKNLGIEGEETRGVISGIDFLRNINMGSKVELGDKVAVIGGGNVAIDAVRTALREGSKNPFIIYRRSELEMLANKEEIEECLEEGIELKIMTQPISIIEQKGKVTGIRCVKMELGDIDESGRRQPTPVAGSEFIMEVDSVISAIGQESDWEHLINNFACTITKKSTMEVSSILQSNEPDIFAGGDAVTGPSTVIEAIAAGKHAAKSIKKFILKEKISVNELDNYPVVNSRDIDISSVPKLTREQMPVSDPEVRKKYLNKEVQLGFDESLIKNELKRCLSCGICSECYQCVDKCLAGAIDHTMVEEYHDINVGAVILSPGFKPFDPKIYDTYNYTSHSNVLTSLEFERVLSASGPYQGKLLKPSNNKPPRKIAWLQCVGSRDINKCDNDYCSSVCCMYANKQAIVAKEHSSKPLDTAIFFMDMRTFGKDFDKYSTRAQEEGVRFIRSRLHSVIPGNDHELRLIYFNEDEKLVEEIFDIVVLSIGMVQDENVLKLAKVMDIELNENGYVKTSDLNPVATSREGIYVCGAFQEPKDIPFSVMEASASVSLASELLSDSRWYLSKVQQLPPEIDVTNDEIRIGVFVCNCGINIGGIADVPAIKEHAYSLPGVVYVEDKLFACSQDSQDHIKDVIVEKNINRVVVASCSPRTHEPLFQETVRNAGLNRYLFEMANIRDQNTWVHMSTPEKATKKAKDLVRMAVANAANIVPLHQTSLSITKLALVIGGGVAGIEASLSIAEQGYNVVLLEKTGKLGGNAKHLRHTWQGEVVNNYLKKIVNSVETHPLIKIHTGTKIENTAGIIGNFQTTIRSNNSKNKLEVIQHGVTIIATGGVESKPKDYLYGSNPNVFTHIDFDLALSENDSRISSASGIAFIQCVGSRNDDRPYCSKVCCTHSLKTAISLKKINPNNKIVILYRDIRSYGFREKLYRQARESGVIFIRYDLEKLPSVYEDEEGSINLNVIDHILRKQISLKLDILVLATGILPSNIKELSKLFKLPSNNDGFFLEAHAKLRPVDFSFDGVFLAGLAHYPKPLEESITQAKASAARAMTILSSDNIKVGGIVASVDSTRCACCLTCVRTCPYRTPVVKASHSYATIDSAGCHGCGICVSECPGKAIQLKHFTDKQIFAKTRALFVV